MSDINDWVKEYLETSLFYREFGISVHDISLHGDSLLFKIHVPIPKECTQNESFFVGWLPGMLEDTFRPKSNLTQKNLEKEISELKKKLVNEHIRSEMLSDLIVKHLGKG